MDATFRRRIHREAFAAGYGGAGPAPIFVECRAPAAVVAERADRRLRDPGQASDATAEIAARQLAEFAPLDEVDADRHVIVRTDREVRETIDEIEAALDARLARSGRAPPLGGAAPGHHARHVQRRQDADRMPVFGLHHNQVGHLCSS